MERQITCLRCDHKMNHIKRDKIQFGQTGWILGYLPNLIAGAMELDIYSCPECGKVEFFLVDDESPDESLPDESLPQRQCPNCGGVHDFDYPKCPFCKYDYEV